MQISEYIRDRRGMLNNAIKKHRCARGPGKFVNEGEPDNLSTTRAVAAAAHGFRVHEDVLPSLGERLTTFSPSYLLGHVEAENVLLRSLNWRPTSRVVL